MDVNWCRIYHLQETKMGYYTLFKSSLKLNFRMAEAAKAKQNENQ